MKNPHTGTYNLRWTLRQAEREFPADRETLAKRLSRAGERPGADGKYSTQQIASVVFSEVGRERMRHAQERADAVAEDNAQRRAGLISPADAASALRRYADAAIRIIAAHPKIPEEERAEVVREFDVMKKVTAEDFRRNVGEAES